MPARAVSRVPARIRHIAVHLPGTVLSNEDLAEVFPDWPASKILAKTGIRERRIASPDETALDLAVAAGDKLLADLALSPEKIDFVIFCTQAPDYFLPTSACILQHRLGLPRSIGAIDINLGCSGFVYSLSVASGLIAAGAARRILLVTADTYSKFIHPGDKSVRTLFGDGAAATLIEAGEGESAIGPFVFGTDGGGAEELIVPAGGLRCPTTAETATVQADKFGNERSLNNLYMNGGAVLNFTLREVPRAVDALLAMTGSEADQYAAVVMHQANKFMLDTLQAKLDLPAAKVPRCYEYCGNTVSATIPITLEQMMRDGQWRPGARLMLLGFGVGLSWAAADIIV